MNKRTTILIAVLLLAACALPFVVSNYRTFQFTLVLVYAIALLGLNLLTGYNGQISLGHGAFYAIGAYTAAIRADSALSIGTPVLFSSVGHGCAHDIAGKGVADPVSVIETFALLSGAAH